MYQLSVIRASVLTRTLFNERKYRVIRTMLMNSTPHTNKINCGLVTLKALRMSAMSLPGKRAWMLLLLLLLQLLMLTFHGELLVQKLQHYRMLS